MFDRFDRKIDYLRISVTDKCDLRCVYCMPAEGVPHLRHEDVLSFEEILEVTRAAVAMGVVKVRITGGEPLVRRGIVALVSMLAGVEGIDDLAMTTNGTRLAAFARPLADAGLRRVNISLDALDAARYAAITRGGDVADVFAGIEAARDAGLDPIKLNCVVRESPDEPDARAVAAFGAARGIEVRYIRRMNLSDGVFTKVIGGRGGDCPRCNRLRLSCDGMVRPCLFSDLVFSVRELGPVEAIRRAVAEKPRSEKRTERLCRKAARRSSAFFLESSSIIS
ncbi:MAG TPA: radical SAM protein [Candidatus Hydrogenedentes bacterium]|nr:radical SAM protein [Candidatus Hydrogenedentota bacterium]